MRFELGLSVFRRVGPWTLFAGFVCMAGCSSSPPDFGTLPTVAVEFDEPGPTREAVPVPKPKPEPQAVILDPPDPAPISTRDQLEYLFAFEKGEMKVVSHRAFQVAQPEPTTRRVGRFAVEFWTGAQMLERVRFDFPLLGGTEVEGDQAIEQGLSAQKLVRVPFVERATSARLLDRKTRKVIELAWPPSLSVPTEATP